MYRFSTLLFALALGCGGSEPPAVDGGGPREDGGTRVVDAGAPGDGGGPIDSGPSASDARPPTTDPAMLCARLAMCAGSDEMACLDRFAAERSRLEPLGCDDELARANDCSYFVLTPGPGGECGSDYERCDATYREFNRCVVDATGVEAFRCEASSTIHSCVEYRGSGNDPASTCAVSSATRVDMCSTDAVVGTCVVDAVGGVTVTSTYYAPLPTGVTAAFLQSLCEMQMGTWTMP